MKVVTRNDALRIEARDLNLRRMSIDDLILSVAMSLEDVIVKDAPKSVVFACGKGRNGNYGFMCAHLLRQDTNIDIKICTDRDEDDYYVKMMNNDLIDVISAQRMIKTVFSESDYVVDCIFGIEQEQTSAYPYDYWISWINEVNNYVLSCDFPSGINPDNGVIENVAIKANKTITLQLPKLGLYLYPASDCVGELIIETIGLTFDSIQTTEEKYRTNSYSEISSMLPQRKAHSHKGSYGKVLLIAGSEGTTGAAILSGKAILKCGAGLLTIMSYQNVIDIVTNTLFEAMTIPVTTDNIRTKFDNLDLNNYSLIVLGPGLGRNSDTEYLLQKVLKTNLPVVLDADGLFYLGKHLDLLEREALTVITPHQGEYERIFEFNRATIVKDLTDITTKYPSLIVVFKGERTLIAYQGKITINTTGNNALAKGGSGDVLTGVIGGLFAQKPDYESVVVAVYIHSLAADNWVTSSSSYSLLASDLIEEVDHILFNMSKGQ